MSDTLNVDFRYHLSNRKTRSKFKKQRSVKGFCDGDVWDMNSYLLTLIPAMLDHLAENTHGYPTKIIENGVARKMDEKTWPTFLHELSNRFKHIEDRVNADIASDQEYEQLLLDTKDAFSLLAENFYTLWD